MKKALYLSLEATAVALSFAAGFVAGGLLKSYLDIRYQRMLDLQEDKMEAFCDYYGLDDPGEYFAVLQSKGLSAWPL